MPHDWYHRTWVAPEETGTWYWECKKLNCVKRTGLDRDKAFQNARIHTWVGGYRNTDDYEGVG